MFDSKVLFCAIICVVVSVFMALKIFEDRFQEIEKFYLKDVSSGISDIFNYLDIDQNGVLSINEFSSLKQNFKLFKKESRNQLQSNIQTFPALPVQLKDQIVHIEVHYQPLILSSLKKKVHEKSENQNSTLRGLLDWKKPNKDQHAFSAKSFSAFLPPFSNAQPGYSYWIADSSLTTLDSDPISSNRKHFPPTVADDLLILHALLSLFHPKPFIWMRFKPQGTIGVVRAVSDNFYDIFFRIHAEFQLNEPPLYPLWFTPSQFRGRLIVNKDGTVVKFFHMEVPDSYLNVDLEWYNGEEEDSMEVDIGRIGKMSLISTHISVPSSTESGADEDLSSIKWVSEISETEAIEILEKRFFSFTQVKYYEMGEAFAVASQQSKLVHGVVLWGSLSDQSC